MYQNMPFKPVAKGPTTPGGALRRSGGSLGPPAGTGGSVPQPKGAPGSEGARGSGSSNNVRAPSTMRTEADDQWLIGRESRVRQIATSIGQTPSPSAAKASTRMQEIQAALGPMGPPSLPKALSISATGSDTQVEKNPRAPSLRARLDALGLRPQSTGAGTYAPLDADVHSLAAEIARLEKVAAEAQAAAAAMGRQFGEHAQAEEGDVVTHAYNPAGGVQAMLACGERSADVRQADSTTALPDTENDALMSAMTGIVGSEAGVDVEIACEVDVEELVILPAGNESAQETPVVAETPKKTKKAKAPPKKKVTNSPAQSENATPVQEETSSGETPAKDKGKGKDKQSTPPAAAVLKDNPSLLDGPITVEAQCQLGQRVSLLSGVLTNKPGFLGSRVTDAGYQAWTSAIRAGVEVSANGIQRGFLACSIANTYKIDDGSAPADNIDQPRMPPRVAEELMWMSIANVLIPAERAPLGGQLEAYVCSQEFSEYMRSESAKRDDRLREAQLRAAQTIEVVDDSEDERQVRRAKRGRNQ
ncbi:hypothetical protein BD309DRAFT_966452 [Dichomitus squalens]|nr:hypothetical protein BD309DRAFT_966452 [Dichomitus squalens]